ncbi:AAA family ATPase [Microscilla marina]|uniref:Anticodon nuclease n=1 Tax=Microscilla marina ATCC 23134 TaxID=313606 RepID=A1ZEM9_MICM2|nr:AAA family ATPase [Microscilla marina]EAY30981.1 anticodon nuclease [Microscilla marina ATCC 23134]
MSNQSSNNNPIKADLTEVAKAIQHRLNSRDLVLLFAYNGTGKTRLSMEFKNLSKNRRQNPETNTLYFNAYTEDLFVWNNDLDGDTERYLQMNKDSKFFDGFEDLALEVRIEKYLQNYVDFDFRIDYEDWRVIFSRNEITDNNAQEEGEEANNNEEVNDSEEEQSQTVDFIKVSRGEENLFVWCIFLAIAEIAIEDHELTNAYSWVKYIYIDDPISSLDDNNTITVATDLAQLLGKAKERGKEQSNPSPVKVVVSTHHALFYNIMEKDLRVRKTNYFLHKKAGGYLLQGTDQSPFFHHVALLAELKHVASTGNIKTYHFNGLRTLLEKVAAFFGYRRFQQCIEYMAQDEDEVLFNRAVQLMSHGGYSVYEAKEMVEDNKKIFRKVLTSFLDKYEFEVPNI